MIFETIWCEVDDLEMSPGADGELRCVRGHRVIMRDKGCYCGVCGCEDPMSEESRSKFPIMESKLRCWECRQGVIVVWD